ncbi:MAG: SMC-Scp complex subunit ScpB [Thermoguttaceae bacterium]
MVRRELLSIEREQKDKKRISYYKTTDRFLQLFGLDSLNDLPVSDDVDEI